jgi:hypothetical protein
MSIMFLQIYGSSELLSTPPQKMGLFRFVDCFPYIFNLDSSLQHSNQPLFLFSLLSLPWPLGRKKMTRVGGGLKISRFSLLIMRCFFLEKITEEKILG